VTSTKYALLIAPSSNRVYSSAATALTMAELDVFNETMLGGALHDVAVSKMGSVDYVTFAAEHLGRREIAVLSNLSSMLALFALDAGKLTPIDLERLDRFDSDLVSIQKYQGKTNENFTKLLLNVTLAASAFSKEFPERRFSVLDPLSGRGTTLNQALMYGFDCAGIEIDKKAFEAYAVFIERWAKDKRLKHQFQRGKVKGYPKLNLVLGADKEAYKAGNTISVTCVNADTIATGDVLPPRSFDLLVTDAPYGVQHGSQTPGHGASRKPLELLRSALPAWRDALRTGGAMGIAWNTFVAKREALESLLEQAGLVVQRSTSFLAFEHRVDQAILRDVVVARRN
jgi:hypothetical protein